MTATDQNIGLGNDPYFAGDSLVITVDVDKSDGTDKGLTGANPSWVVEDNGEEVLSDGDTGVTVTVSDAAAGEVEIDIDPGTTDGLYGMFEHYVRIEDAAGEKTVVTTGDILITKRGSG